MLWCAAADAVPLYPLYVLLFTRAGISERGVSALFAIWSATAVLAEVPAGALADRVSRRGALVAACLLQAAAYALWLTVPTFAGFAAGFVLWGIGGSLSGGAFRALLHDGLTALGEPGRFGAALGRAEAAGFAVQVPVAGSASALMAAGGLVAVGVASVASCLLAAALAATLPDLRPAGRPGADAGAARIGTVLRTAARSVATRAAIAAIALLAAVAAIEEYTPLMASGWGLAATAVPPALLAIPLAGAAGSALGGRHAERIGAVGLVAVLGLGAIALTAAVTVAHPAGLAAVALAFGTWTFAAVVADVRLQRAITGPARATVTGVAGLAGELATIGLFALWAAGGAWAAAALAAAAAALVPVLVRRRAPQPGGGDSGSAPGLARNQAMRR